LRCSCRSVHGVGADLVQPMPVDASGLIPQSIEEVDDQVIAQGSMDGRQGKLVVDPYNWTDQTAVGVSQDPGEAPVVGQDGGSGHRHEGGAEE